MASIQVILTEKIDGLGAEADLVKVRGGYARNFLLPQGLALEATKGNLNRTNALRAKRIAREGAPGLMVLASDGRYHTAPGDPEENARMERWMRLREGLELMATVPFPPTVAVDAIPAYQHKNVSEWLGRVVPFVNQLSQLWSEHHA